MSRFARIAIALGVAAAALAVGVARHARMPETPTHPEASPAEADGNRPRFLELGSDTCIPCKAMKDVMEALRQDYGDQLLVDFIDVAQDPDAGHTYAIRIIPTQILFAPDGTELFRHEGFYPKDDIVAKWKELGIPLQARPAGGSEPERLGMVGRLLAYLTHAVRGSGPLALAAAFLWGVLSILLSPCHLASIPLIVGFIDGQGNITTRRAFVISLLFSLGMLLTIVALGVLSSAAGRMMGDLGLWGAGAMALVFLLVGLHLLDVLPAPWEGPGQMGMKRKGLWAAFLLGLVFGIALGPCTFAFMAPMLAMTFSLGAERLLFGITLLALYAIGHCGVIVLAGTFTEAVQHYMRWNERSRGALILRRACGALVVLAGLLLIWKM